MMAFNTEKFGRRMLPGVRQVLPLVLFVLFFAAAANAQNANRKVTVALRGVYDAKLSVTPFVGMKLNDPLIKDVQVVNKGKLEVTIPERLLPGEFLFRFDYRAKASDSPYPAEISLFINRENMAMNVNPLYTRGDSLTLTGDVENKVFGDFMEKNAAWRRQLGLLQQLVAGYDKPAADVVKQAYAEFEARRKAYNQWISDQIMANSSLYVPHLFVFQYMPAMPPGNIDTPEKAAARYFDAVSLNDTLVLRSRQFNEFMGGYMGLFGQLATTLQLRDSLFTLAGSIACEKASKGDPKIYGWMVDYFYTGYESYNIAPGMKMLEAHLNSPRCLTSKKIAIQKRLEGMKNLVVGAPAPAFEAQMADSMAYRFDGIPKNKPYALLVFYDSTCSHCNETIDELKKWYAVPENKVWLNVVTVSVDDDRQKWDNWHRSQNLPWNDVWAPGGINSKAAASYYILSAPALYLVDKDMKIAAAPTSVADIDRFLNTK